MSCAADFESQLEIVAEVPRESVRLLPDERFEHILLFVWTAAAGEKKQRNRGKMCSVPPGSTEEEQVIAMLGSAATSRKSNSSALQEDRTPLGTSADITRTHPPGTPTRAVRSTSDADLAEVLENLATLLNEPRSSQLLEKEFGVDPGVATTKPECTEDVNGGSEGRGLRRLGGHAQVQRILCVRHGYLGVTKQRSR